MFEFSSSWKNDSGPFSFYSSTLHYADRDCFIKVAAQVPKCQPCNKNRKRKIKRVWKNVKYGERLITYFSYRIIKLQLIKPIAFQRHCGWVRTYSFIVRKPVDKTRMDAVPKLILWIGCYCVFISYAYVRFQSVDVGGWWVRLSPLPSLSRPPPRRPHTLSWASSDCNRLTIKRWALSI